MSRSKRKTPKVGHTTAESEKAFKQFAHRAERRATKISVANCEEPPDPKAFGEPWDGPKDGKQWLGKTFQHLLRK